VSTLVIARLTFHEAARRRILFLALLLSLVFLVVFALGFHFINLEFEKQADRLEMLQLSQMRNFTLTAGMYVVNFLTIMMTVLTSVDTRSGEISSGSIHTLASKPIRRWEIVLGKWLGFAGMLSLYLLLMGGGILLVVFLRTGYSAPHPWRALALTWLNALILLSISLAGGASLSTLANGVLIFGLYGVAFIGGWIERIGSFIQAQAGQAAVNIGILTSLLIPSEALWSRAAHEMQSSLITSLGISPFSTSSYPSNAMIVYAMLYLVGAFALAVWRFSRRDL